jgi:8-oxo-dGTP pyrophosphatase MutT (NUDIX family)
MRRVASCVIALDERGNVLLHRRADNGWWALPGGRIELDETAAQAAVRETREETGFDVEVVRLVGVYSDPAYTTIRYPDGDVVCYVALAFECRLVGGTATLSDESLEVRWFSPDEALVVIAKNHVPRLRDALERRPAAFVR